MKLMNLLEKLIIQSLMESMRSIIKKFPKIPEETIRKLVIYDPYYDKKNDILSSYGKWILTVYSNSLKPGAVEITEDEFPEFGEVLTDVINYPQKFAGLDLFKFKTLDALKEYVEEKIREGFSDRQVEKMFRKEDEELRKAGVSREAEKVLETDDWEVWKPFTRAAACVIGNKTKWCVTSNSVLNQFDFFADRGELYLLINKHNPDEKYAFYFNMGHFSDKNNDPIDPFKLFKQYPELNDYFRKIEGEEIKHLEPLYLATDQEASPEELINLFNNNKSIMVQEYLASNPNTPEEVLRELIKSPQLSVIKKLLERDDLPDYLMNELEMNRRDDIIKMQKLIKKYSKNNMMGLWHFARWFSNSNPQYVSRREKLEKGKRSKRIMDLIKGVR